MSPLTISMKIISQHSLTTLVCVLAFSTLSACSNHDDHNHPNLKSGEALFNHHCAECHGEDGTGKLAYQTPANILTIKGHRGIVDYVTTDINSNREMPVFSSMSYSEATQIASQLLTLRKVYDATPNNKKKPRPLLIEP